MQLPDLNLDYGDLYQMLLAPIRTKLVLTGIELNIFNHLSTPISADAVAQVLDTHPRNTELLLNGLAAINLVVKTNDCFQNTPLAQAFLVDGFQTYIGHLLTFMANADAPLDNLTQLVKDGPPPPPDAYPFSEDILVQGASMMANTQRARRVLIF